MTLEPTFGLPVRYRLNRAERAAREVELQEAQRRQQERRDVFEDARTAAFKVDATLALAAHIMGGATALDDERRFLAKADPTLNMLLAEIEGEAIQQVRAIQRTALSPWEF